jgi:polyisoprenoid-binding protein YceI
MMISNVKGEFTAVTGKLEVNNADITKSKIEASIDASSINTREPQRDAHLKSADFLDVEKFPVLTFKSTRVSKVKVDELSVEGNLTIHGVTRNVVFEVEGPSAPVKDPWGSTRIGISATTRIDRKDFGLTWNATLEAGGIMVGHEVTITLDVEFVKA